MWPNPQETANLVTFTKEILNEKLHFLCSVWSLIILVSQEESLFFSYEERDFLESSFFGQPVTISNE